MAKVFAFNPPSERVPTSRTGNIGQGVYYARLGMRKPDMERRMREHQQTGRDYLETTAAYNVEKGRMK